MFHVEQNEIFDLVVVGGGHAGVEAINISCQFLTKVALISLPNIGLASAPCNPSIGGVGKGQVVRELDSLGGLMPILADLAGIQYRTLNDSKGYAVQSTRVQIDKDKYSKYAEEFLSKLENLNIFHSRVDQVQNENEIFKITLDTGKLIFSKAIVMTVGTFLNGKLHCGREITSGGRVDSQSVKAIDSIFTNIKKNPVRFKTGTPARIIKTSINFDKLEVQPSDNNTLNFHFKNYYKSRNLKQLDCYLTRTNAETMKIIRDNKEKSPMYNGQIKATGARYCPSIEDKAYRYPDKNEHHVFIEPEGIDLDTFYPSGISSSLPKEVQESFIKSINGLENCEIKVHGYAVEYDVVDTTSLDHSLQYKDIPGLYFAGQVNGTSGYEEAAAQGFVAGLNAALKINNQPAIHFSRNDSYIGVLIEDLISNKRDEPYRLFTARNESRLNTREDNTVTRMYKYRKMMGLYNEIDLYNDDYIEQYFMLHELISTNYLHNSDPILIKLTGKNDFENKVQLSEVLKQSWIDPIKTLNYFLNFIGLYFKNEVIKNVAIDVKYSGYAVKNKELLERVLRLDSKKIDLNKILSSKNVSFECKQRIKEISPVSFGQLKRIEGLRPSSIASIAASL